MEWAKSNGMGVDVERSLPHVVSMLLDGKINQNRGDGRSQVERASMLNDLLSNMEKNHSKSSGWAEQIGAGGEFE